MAKTDIGSRLQHPRRSLGNRHRSQAENSSNYQLTTIQISLGLNKVHDKPSFMTLLTQKIGEYCFQ